ncbi:MAG: DUF5110 domain-containing protein, partial [Gammaproteobacteria bacterium]|nr:DUF5110 domain-containing protein [Gammaproteobacteria bacterium]
GQMYDDDGKSRTSIEDRSYELLKFDAQHIGDSLRIALQRDAGDYEGMPAEREITIVVHNWTSEVSNVRFAGVPVDLKRRTRKKSANAHYDTDKKQLIVRVAWDHAGATLQIN